MTNGEPAMFYAESGLKKNGEGVSYEPHSFEACLIRMLDSIGLRRETPEFWDANNPRLRFDWIPPDNQHRTNFPR
jgi:hypothetical protein